MDRFEKFEEWWLSQPSYKNADKDVARKVFMHFEAENAKLIAERDGYKIRGDGHWETLKSIREIAKDGDLERIIQWVNDSGSGYTEPNEKTLSRLMDENQKLLAEREQWMKQDSQHTDDISVDIFAHAMKKKMAESRAKGRHGWDDSRVCTDDDLARMLGEHLLKKNSLNFVDIGNFCMMLHVRAAAPDVLHTYAVRAWRDMIDRQLPAQQVPEGYKFERFDNNIVVTAPDGGQDVIYGDEPLYQLIFALSAAPKPEMIHEKPNEN